ncbi:hypothetical protein ACNKHV_12300 [Shigella flexneri]
MFIAKSMTIRISAWLGVSSSEEPVIMILNNSSHWLTVDFISLNRPGVNEMRER